MEFEPRDAQKVRVRYSLAATFGLTRPWKFLHLRLALIEIVMKPGSLVGSPRLSLLDRHWNKTKLWVFRKSSGKSKATRCGQNKNDQYFTAAINATIQIRVCKKKKFEKKKKKNSFKVWKKIQDTRFGSCWKKRVRDSHDAAADHSLWIGWHLFCSGCTSR